VLDFQRQLEDERHSRSDLEDRNAQLLRELEETKRKCLELEAGKFSLEEQVDGLTGQVSQLTTQLATETQSRQKEGNTTNERNVVQNRGLGEMKKHLERHVEDLRRWQKFLDVDRGAVDFSGEIRPQIMTEITNQNFDSQLQALVKRLSTEDDELTALLKQREAEQKAKKDLEAKKKERQAKSKKTDD